MRTEAERLRQKRYRDRQQKENETKGRSFINPTGYEKDMTVQVWLDSRDVATISEWLDRQTRTKYLSEVIQEGLRVLADHLVKTEQIEKIDDTTAARELIEWKYRVKLNYAGRGKKNAIHNQVLTERRREIGGSIEYVDEKNDVRGRPIYETDVRDRIDSEKTGMEIDKFKEFKEAWDKVGRKNEEEQKQKDAERRKRVNEALKKAMEAEGKDTSRIDEDEEMSREAYFAKRNRERIIKDKEEAEMDMTAPSSGLVKLEKK